MLKELLVCLAFAGSSAMAQDKSFTLQSPSALTDTGLLNHILPRFSLKTGIRITLSEDEGIAAFGPDGDPVFRQGDTIWHFRNSENDNTQAFYDWLTSDVGKRTVEGFTPDEGVPFSADVSVQVAAVVVALTGDAVLGEDVSLSRCGRCHVVNDSNRMNAIGSTPSFALMRSFSDWEGRFQTFYLLRPHAAFTQVKDVTDPFPDNLPSPIAPIEVTLDEIDAIVAYVGTIAPADLGGPIQSQ
ncbi:hypothetical protein [Loktanella sp. Alg231-35]|uniref:hypothetical protein n=1 Tax=Loktanella sp. Alg231-35 TaxID=1922220 RepID=UPI000D55FEBF|nr:hypothetical protein [Loktanella sp. Alg231-35]